MKSKWFPTMFFVTALFSAQTAAQGDPSTLQVWRTNAPAIVKLTVTGQDRVGSAKPATYGTGVMVPPGVIVTALHVVGSDDDWKREPDGAILRYIDVEIMNEHLLPSAIGRASVRAVPNMDIAILTVNGENYKTAELASSRPAPFSRVIVIPWTPGRPQPQPRGVDTTLTDRSSDGDVLTLFFSVIEGHSGSPVFNTAGKLVGIVTNRKEGDTAIAQFADLFKNALPSAVVSAESAIVIARGTISYTYEINRDGTTCTGRWERFENHWTEYIPMDRSCNIRAMDYGPIAEDAEWYYAYDASRDLTARLPKAGGNLQWILTKVAPPQASGVEWSRFHVLTKIQ